MGLRGGYYMRGDAWSVMEETRVVISRTIEDPMPCVEELECHPLFPGPYV